MKSRPALEPFMILERESEHANQHDRQKRALTAVAKAEEARMDAIEFLTKDHEAVKALLTAANTYEEMNAAFGEISRMLETHTYLEERFFYPHFDKHEHLRQLIQEAREQHDLVKQLLDGLKHQKGQEFETNFQALKAEVQLHMTSEEGEIFPQAESFTDAATLTRLGNELQSAKISYERASEIPVRAAR